MKLGIIAGSIRTGRRALEVAQWVQEAALELPELQPTLLDLADFDLPHMVEEVHPMAANRQYADIEVQRWSQVVDACEAFVFVTPEYNHSVPGSFKNAVDLLGPEWLNKTVGFVSYGSVGGVRAVEHWRTILSNFNIHTIRSQVALSIFNDFNEDGFAPNDQAETGLTNMLTDLVTATQRS